MSIHDQIGAFVDGELSDAEADAFRDHLPDCAECQAELHELMQLAALPQPKAVISDIELARAKRAKPRSKMWMIAPAGVALAAAAGLVLYLRSGDDPAGNKTPDHVAIALAPERQLEGRLSWDGASAHRPYAVQRSGGNAGEATSLKVQAALEERGDLHGLGALAVLAGDPKRAKEFLDKASGSAAVDSDRALVALAAGDPETAVRLTESALAQDPNLAAARWNRALALRDLGLPRAAAAEFDAVAASGEPGWADEARARSQDLIAADQAEADAWERVIAIGPQLEATGEGLTAADVTAQPGLVRLYLYDAIRSAPDAARVRSLRPIAEALDAAIGSRMAAHVDAIAARDFAVRAPLAKAYAELKAGTDVTKLVEKMRKAGEIDLAIGALIRASAGAVTEAQLPDLRALAKQSGDPWFELIAVEQEARLARAAGDTARAEAVLGPALARCEKDPVVYRCPRVAATIADLYIDSQRLVEAGRAVTMGWGLARRTGDRRAQDALLPLRANLAALSDDVTALPIARAVADELRLRRPDWCYDAVWGHELLGMMLLNQLRYDEARRELDAVPAGCDETQRDRPDRLQGVFARAHLLRRAGAGPDFDIVQREIDALRSDANPSELAFLDHVEGRMLVERSPSEGQALLVRATTARGDDAMTRKARGYSFAVLALDAGRRNAHGEALGRLADERAVTVPATCTVGAVIDDDRSLVVVRGADGVDRAAYVEGRTSPVVDTSTLVPANLRASLTGCAVVSVLARPPIEGAPDLLPSDLAWGYGVVSTETSAPRGARLVVHDVEAPTWLGLPRLATRTPPADAISLSGAAATPTRVRAAMADASIIEIDAHGLVNSAVDEASHVVLSAEAGGHYALDVPTVRATPLRGEPVVVLAACHAATAAPYLHESWGLPAAFVHSGARAVVASTDEIPDADAGAFFSDFIERLASSPPAVALRDARQAWLSSHPKAAWLHRVVLFE